MPLYNYKCGSCECRFTRIRRIADRKDPIDCPECGNSAEYSPTFETQPPIFKGSGFYETEYKRKKS